MYERNHPGATVSTRRNRTQHRLIRLLVLATILLGMTTLSLLHQRGGTFRPVGVDALCPFGGVETLWAFLSQGALIKKIALSSIILLGLITGMALLFGRVFCGYLCPLGALQEFAGSVRRLLGMKSRATVPPGIDKWGRILKYVVLAFFTAGSWTTASLVIRPYDPWVAWTHLSSGELVTEFSVGLGVLLVAVIGSVFYDRVFCKYACPMGALLALMKPLAVYGIVRDTETCIDCGACTKACPVNIDVAVAEKVTSAECLSCNECVNACPVPDALSVTQHSTPGAPALSPNRMLATSLGLVVGVLVLSSVFGSFAWTMPSAADAIAAPGGTIDASQIRGSMTFADISAASGIPLEAFEQRFGVPIAQMNLKAKDLAPVYGFDVHTDLREWVQLTVDSGAVAPSGTTGAAGAPAGED